MFTLHTHSAHEHRSTTSTSQIPDFPPLTPVYCMCSPWIDLWREKEKNNVQENKINKINKIRTRKKKTEESWFFFLRDMQRHKRSKTVCCPTHTLDPNGLRPPALCSMLVTLVVVTILHGFRWTNLCVRQTCSILALSLHNICRHRKSSEKAHEPRQKTREIQ